jgi:drug/metabolite transporter (DMT)-like permease
VGLYAQVVAAAGYAWLLLGERLAPVQILGAVVVLIAIAFARSVRRAPAPAARDPAAAA